MSKFKVKQNECAQMELKYSNNCSIEIVWSGSMFFFLIRTHCTLRIANSKHYKRLKYKRECKTNCHNLFGQVRMPPENIKIMKNNFFINKTEEKLIYDQNNCKFKNLYRPIFNVRPVDSHLIEIDYLFRKKNMSVSQAKRNE